MRQPSNLSELWHVCSARIRFTFSRYVAEKPFVLQKAEVFDETYQGRFDGGRQLPMSCGAEKGLSQAERADEAAAEACASGSDWGDVPLVTLPLGLWFRYRPTPQDCQWRLWFGCLRTDDHQNPRDHEAVYCTHVSLSSRERQINRGIGCERVR
jgi:hypothetical protein